MSDPIEKDSASSLPDEPFAKHFGPRPPPVSVKFGGLSHPGRVRTVNEDHFLVAERRRSRSVLLTNVPREMLQQADDVAYIMAVADGLGGAAFGELASMVALQSGWDVAPQALKWTWIITDREVEELKERAEIVFRRMDKAILAHGIPDPECFGMATTLTCAYTVGPEAFVGHVGDSRAYLFHNGQLTQVTRDHTVAQQCLDLGLPVLSRSWHHMLTKCLGGGTKDLDIDFHHLTLADGDQLLLCTDGLFRMVPSEELAAILAKQGDPQEAAQALVDRALEHGGNDNVTVILAHYSLQLPPGEAP
jgi:serine/threonine protein phosphatase PrpC